MFGLIEARGGLYGFRDLAAARQVAGLLAAGTALSVITAQPARDPQMAARRGAVEPQLFPESSDRILVEQVQGRTDKKGQFVLDVDTPADDADAAVRAGAGGGRGRTMPPPPSGSIAA